MKQFAARLSQGGSEKKARQYRILSGEDPLIFQEVNILDNFQYSKGKEVFFNAFCRMKSIMKEKVLRVKGLWAGMHMGMEGILASFIILVKRKGRVQESLKMDI